jgi:hypothetical protein
MSLPPIPNTKLLEDPTRDAIWKRWLNISFKNVNAVSSALYVSSAAFHTSTDFATSSHSHANASGFLQCVYTNENYTVSSNISAITGVDLTLVGTSNFTISGTGRLTIV